MFGGVGARPRDRVELEQFRGSNSVIDRYGDRSYAGQRHHHRDQRERERHGDRHRAACARRHGDRVAVIGKCHRRPDDDAHRYTQGRAGQYAQSRRYMDHVEQRDRHGFDGRSRDRGGTGRTTITATSEGRTGTATITVPALAVGSVVVAPTTAALIVGQTAPLSATVTNVAGTVVTDRVVTWTTSGPNVATVS